MTKTRPFGAASCLFLSAALTLAAPAGATPWHDFGPRAMGMGGAGVALAQGPEAVYWNPAGLGQLYNADGFSMPIGLRTELTGTALRGANDLFQLSEACRGGGSLCTASAVSRALDDLGGRGSGALADVAGGFAIKIGKAAFFALNESYAGATPRADRINVGACPGVNCLSNNDSALILRGGSFTEFGAGYGLELKETGLLIGANLKGILGKVGFDEFRIITQDPGLGKLSNFKDNARVSFMPAVDLGLLWDLRETWPDLRGRPRLGLTGRNVNCPTFSQPAAAKAAGETDRFALQGQARLGAALSPADSWHLVGDIDLTHNNTEVDGFTSRVLALGTEVDLFNQPEFNLPLRFGLKKNLAESSSGLTFTAGFGLNFLHVLIDLAGQLSAKSADERSLGVSRSAATNLGASFRFAMLYGGGEERDGAGPRRRRAAD